MFLDVANTGVTPVHTFQSTQQKLCHQETLNETIQEVKLYDYLQELKNSHLCIQETKLQILTTNSYKEDKNRKYLKFTNDIVSFLLPYSFIVFIYIKITSYHTVRVCVYVYNMLHTK